MKTSRRTFFQRLGFGAIGLAATPTLLKARYPEPKPVSKKVKFELGVASYGLRGLSFDEMVEGMKILGIRNLSLKSMHLPFELSNDELKQRMKVMRDAGLNPYAPGVVYMKSEQEVHDRFAYTQTAGMKMIVAVPNYELLDLVEEKIKETGIRIAIHTHGPDNLPYPTPEDAYNRIKHRDPRFGICIDLAHALRSGLDPADQLKIVKDRVFDIHIRDITEAAKEGHSIRPGQGVFDFKASLQALIDIEYSGFLSIEYEAEEKSPIPGYAETKGYINGVLSGMGY
ncbi:sugar phosphate isomerase/epimerase family protein [Bacteroidota bacterium]